MRETVESLQKPGISQIRVPVSEELGASVEGMVFQLYHFATVQAYHRKLEIRNTQEPLKYRPGEFEADNEYITCLDDDAGIELISIEEFSDLCNIHKSCARLTFSLDKEGKIWMQMLSEPLVGPHRVTSDGMVLGKNFRFNGLSRERIETMMEE